MDATCNNKYITNLKLLEWHITTGKSSIQNTLISFLVDPSVNLEKCSELYAPHLKELVNKKIIFDRAEASYSFIFNQDFITNIYGNIQIPQSFFDFFGFIKQKDCTIQELMTLEGEHALKICTPKSISQVSGSCSKPGFFHKSSDMTLEEKTKFLELLKKIELKLSDEEKPRYFDIILGATTSLGTSFSNENNAYSLNINPFPTQSYYTLDDLLTELDTYTSLKNKNHILKIYFPLFYSNRPNNKEILDKLLEMRGKGITLRITNKMCGSCHPSLYYLVKHGAEYIVDPEQKLSEDNTPNIRRCFK